jgi:hypothetical protein
MREVHSSKWQEAKKDEMESIIPIIFWDLELIPKEPKQ